MLGEGGGRLMGKGGGKGGERKSRREKENWEVARKEGAGNEDKREQGHYVLQVGITIIIKKIKYASIYYYHYLLTGQVIRNDWVVVDFRICISAPLFGWNLPIITCMYSLN